MDPKDFCYWLQGYIELSDATSLTPAQIKMIRDHLQTVFNKVTPVSNNLPAVFGTLPQPGISGSIFTC